MLSHQYHQNLLHHIRENNVHGISLVWEHKTPNYPYLCEALENHSFDAARWILEKNPGAITDKASGWKNTPLMMCTDDKEVQLLLDYGVDVNVQDDGGCTALHWFCWDEPQINLVPLLLRGANERITDIESEYPWGYATTHKQASLLEHFRKLVMLMCASHKKEITLSTDLVRQLRPYLYSV
jgi:hypothetical protein